LTFSIFTFFTALEPTWNWSGDEVLENWDLKNLKEALFFIVYNSRPALSSEYTNWAHLGPSFYSCQHGLI
jgi:hypothetical protein